MNVCSHIILSTICGPNDCSQTMHSYMDRDISVNQRDLQLFTVNLMQFYHAWPQSTVIYSELPRNNLHWTRHKAFIGHVSAQALTGAFWGRRFFNFKLHNTRITSSHCLGLVVQVHLAGRSALFIQLVLLQSNKMTCLVLPLISCCLFSLPELILCVLSQECQNNFLKNFPPYIVERVFPQTKWTAKRLILLALFDSGLLLLACSCSICAN